MTVFVVETRSIAEEDEVGKRVMGVYGSQERAERSIVDGIDGATVKDFVVDAQTGWFWISGAIQPDGLEFFIHEMEIQL